MVGGAGSGQQLQPPGSQPGLDGPDRRAVTRQRGVLLVPIAADGGVRAVLRADHQLLAYGAGAPGGLGEPGVDALAVVGMGAGQDRSLQMYTQIYLILCFQCRHVCVCTFTKIHQLFYSLFIYSTNLYKAFTPGRWM